MSREIKFRAWLPGIKRMTHSHTLDELMNWNTKPEDNGTAIWLQYTGLPDRNGRDIYDGDILDGSYINPMTNELVKKLYEVAYERGRYLAKLIGHHPYGTTMLYFENEKAEISGNIYEHPHLLGDKGEGQGDTAPTSLGGFGRVEERSKNMSDYKQKMDELIKKTIIATYETRNAYTSGDMSKPWVVTYSGGKDSTVMTDIILRAMMLIKSKNPELLQRDVYILTAQTHMDFVTDPLKQEELIKIRQFVERERLPVVIKEVSSPPEKSFMYLVIGKGYPLPKSRVNRWCTERLKIEPTEREVKHLEPELKALGVRLSESTERHNSLSERQEKGSEFYSENAFMPIINFTLDDIWFYLAKGTVWGDAEKLSQLYKDATGECGVRKRQAGRGEKVDDPCGARTGCIICPVVTIDKSSQEFAKHHPELQPYVELRNTIIAMYKDPRNKAGRMRDGTVLEYGKGTFTVKARMKLYSIVKQAEEDHKFLCDRLGVKPQYLIYSEELDKLIQGQWEHDLKECPWVEDAMEVGQFYESKIKGLTTGYQLVWNYLHDTPVVS